jgi:hypothetical protein
MTADCQSLTAIRHSRVSRMRVVDINALRALTPHAYAPVPRPARP